MFRSYIGQGYHDTHTPAVILRNVLENPAWYTAYTPYQPEISQGRLEALLNFQQMVADLTGLAISNASLLDEATAAAEAMTLLQRTGKPTSNVFYVADDVLPQTLEVIRTRALPVGIEVKTGPAADAAQANAFGVLLQYPGVNGDVRDYRALTEAIHAAGGHVVVAADLLALTVLTPPGDWGADVAIGNTQRFGVPMGFGGPHAAYLAVRDEFKRQMPGRLVGVTVDAQGKPALRLALQTREQHIRREKATSNVYRAGAARDHGQHVRGLPRPARPEDDRAAREPHRGAARRRREAARLRDRQRHVLRHADDRHRRAHRAGPRIREGEAHQPAPRERHASRRIGRRNDDARRPRRSPRRVCASRGRHRTGRRRAGRGRSRRPRTAGRLERTSAYLTHHVFNRHHSETEMLRYLRSLSDKDLALDRSMIPLGSCTMKLNATSEMLPVTWPEFGRIHPFAPADQTVGYREMIDQLEQMLVAATGYAAVSLQPNARSQGEYAGLLIIHAYHASRGEAHRDVCLIPASAHGTNPASAHMAGMKVVVVACDAQGNVDIADLKAKADAHAKDLAAIMITYPSTHGVFEQNVREICEIVHAHGGRCTSTART